MLASNIRCQAAYNIRCFSHLAEYLILYAFMPFHSDISPVFSYCSELSLQLTCCAWKEFLILQRWIENFFPSQKRQNPPWGGFCMQLAVCDQQNGHLLIQYVECLNLCSPIQSICPVFLTNSGRSLENVTRKPRLPVQSGQHSVSRRYTMKSRNAIPKFHGIFSSSNRQTAA